MPENTGRPKAASEQLYESLVADIAKQLDLDRGLADITGTRTSTARRGYESLVADIAKQLDLDRGLADITGTRPPASSPEKLAETPGYPSRPSAATGKTIDASDDHPNPAKPRAKEVCSPSMLDAEIDDSVREPATVQTRINDGIRVPEVRLVGPNGEQVGIVRLEDALRLAQEADLDLVEVAPQARPPVCKLMDFGKFKYESAQKARESRRNQALTGIEEQKLRVRIDSHEYETKKRNVIRFLEHGNKVKITIMFRGREQSRPELGFRLLQRLADDVAGLGFVESPPKQDGRNMIMVLAPHNNIGPMAKNVTPKARADAAVRDSNEE